MIRFWPRSPRFPVIIDTGVALVGARRAAECSKLIERAGFARSERATPVIDSTADGYGFYAQLLMISPLVSKSRWTKSEIISLYNSRREPWAPEYPSTALGNKAVGRVVADIVELLRLKPESSARRSKNEPRFLQRVESARKDLRAGGGVKLEDVK